MIQNEATVRLGHKRLRTLMKRIWQRDQEMAENQNQNYFRLMITSKHMIFYIPISGFNLYCWKGIHFSQNLDLIFLHLFFGLIIGFHFWLRDLLREFYKKYEVLLIIFFLIFLLFLVSEGLLFVSFFWRSFHSLSSPSLGIWASWCFCYYF